MYFFNLLVELSLLALQNEVSFNAENSQYNEEGETTKQLINDTDKWDIQDHGVIIKNDSDDKGIPSYLRELFASFGLIATVWIVKTRKKHNKQ